MPPADLLQQIPLHVAEPDASRRERVEIALQQIQELQERPLRLGQRACRQCGAESRLQRGVSLALEAMKRAHSVAHARRLIPDAAPGALRVIEGSFYTVELPERFDVVCYWDGFGVGTDEDQHTLLRRIAAWLNPSGVALIDINTPWYWAQVAGQRMTTSAFTREYGFDAHGCRMLDHWWPPEDENQRVTQSLRCYSPQDLRLLLNGTGLRLEGLAPGGAVDYEASSYTPHVSLERAMQYCAHLRRE